MDKQLTYWFWESELSEIECQQIINFHFNESNSKQGVLRGRDGKMGLDPERRITLVSWVAFGNPIFSKIHDYISTANKDAGWNYDITGMEDVQIGKYQESGHYCWHADIGPPCEQNFQRKLSCSVQLSDENTYEGGDLIFQDAGGDKYTAPRKQGSIVVFPSTLRHKVTPVTSGTRFSAVAWMRGPAFK